MKSIVFPLGEAGAVVSGAMEGRKVFAALVAALPANAEPTVVHLDFAGVDVATSSYLRESVLAFRDYCARTGDNHFPVVANPNEQVVEELQLLLRDRSDALWCCQRSNDGAVSAVRVLGFAHLDEAQKETLGLVVRLGRASAPMLFQEDSRIQATGWNNRLSALAAKRLVVEQREGKSKVFSPVLEGN